MRASLSSSSEKEPNKSDNYNHASYGSNDGACDRTAADLGRGRVTSNYRSTEISIDCRENRKYVDGSDGKSSTNSDITQVFWILYGKFGERNQTYPVPQVPGPYTPVFPFHTQSPHYPSCHSRTRSGLAGSKSMNFYVRTCSRSHWRNAVVSEACWSSCSARGNKCCSSNRYSC